ncbi:MAG: 50S ribosomal protein L5, partial [Methyloceanibacter sp.]
MAEQTYIPRLQQHYDEVIKDALVKEFGYANRMQVPRLDKVVLN